MLLGALVAGVAALFVVAVPAALAAGDANVSSCPASTESSPGFRSGLPDCRAYEVVTGANSDDVANVYETYGFPEGEHFMYSNELPKPGEGAAAGFQESFLATRTAQGWKQTSLSVPQGEGPPELTLGVQTSSEGFMFTNDFADALIVAPLQNPLEVPRLDETTGAMVYDLSLSNGAISTVSLPDSGKLTQSMIEFPAVFKENLRGRDNGWGLYLAGASEDGSRVFFSTTAKLATAPGTPQDTHLASGEVYERTGGHTYLVGVLPNGEVPMCGAEVGQSDKSTAESAESSYGSGAISRSGSNVVFHTPGGETEGADCAERETGLFLRNVVAGTTVRLPGAFYAGRAGTGNGEEEKIFTIEPGHIFEYRVAAQQEVEIASENKGLLAYSSSGSRVYYLGPERGIYLYEEGAPTPRLLPGTQQGGYGFSELSQEWSAGSSILAYQPTGRGDSNAPEVTANGNYLMFLSPNKLTSYENCVESEGSERCHVEAYLYDAGTDQVTCVSCAPGGAAPQGDASLVEHEFGPASSEDFVPRSQPLITSRPPEGGREAVMRVVFETTEGLVPQDTNGTMDVYEWEQEESDGCSRAGLKVASLQESPNYNEADHGCLYLLTSGAGREVEGSDVTGGSHLVGASEGLGDIYIETDEPLVPGVDNTAHVYDVREDGGFPAAVTASATGCEPGLCRPEGEGPPVFGEPPSVGFTGAGNLKPVAVKPKAKVKVSLTRKQKLARALKVCKRRKGKRVRAACDRKAQRSYGVKPSSGTHHGHRGGSK